MSAGMAEVIAAHSAMEPEIEDHPVHGYTDVAVCGCGVRLYLGMLGEPNDRDDLHAEHVAEELTKAGYGLVPDVAPEYGARVMLVNGLSDEPQQIGRASCRERVF